MDAAVRTGRERLLSVERTPYLSAQEREEREIGPIRALPAAYYAAFDLATAALYAMNIVRGKHKGVLDAFSEFLVRPRIIEEEYKDIYTRLHNGRLWVDYQRVKKEHRDDMSDDEARQLLRDAGRLIERLERFLRERGAVE